MQRTSWEHCARPGSFLSGQFADGQGAVGAAALAIAERKAALDFTQAVALGTLCNALVCLAVWLGFSARSTTDRVIATIPPIAAFVAAGFELATSVGEHGVPDAIRSSPVE